MINFYEVLGVKADATTKEIHKAYRGLAKEKHPDVCKDEQAVENFQLITDAYKVLSDEDLRKQYDESLKGGDAVEFRFDQAYEAIRDIFNRKNGLVRIKGENYETTIRLTVAQILREEIVDFVCDVDRTCYKCNGEKNLHSVYSCESCKGKGGSTEDVKTPFGSIKKKVPCTTCNGTGKKEPKTCHVCNGNGTIKTPFKKQMKVPNTTYFGEKIVFKGEGGDGLNGGSRGDITFTILEAFDPKYNLEYGNDVVGKEYVSLENMLMQDDILLEMPNGSFQKISLTEHSQNPENKMFFPEQGMMDENGKRGSYSAHLVVDFSKIDAATKDKIVQALRG